MSLEEFVQARQNGTRRPQSPSQRTPASSRHLNIADIIEERMQRDGHRSWGFVIYRTTYANDDDWARFLSRLHDKTQDCFDDYNGQDILDLRINTIMDDARTFKGLDSHSIRDHFRQWVADNFIAEQGEQTQPHPISPRYRFAIQVDAKSLASILQEQEQEGSSLSLPMEQRGWVKLIDVEWFPDRWSTDESYEPIEGCREEDVGWMKKPWSDIHGDMYASCYDRNFWSTHYVRPPILRR